MNQTSAFFPNLLIKIQKNQKYIDLINDSRRRSTATGGEEEEAY